VLALLETAATLPSARWRKALRLPRGERGGDIPRRPTKDTAVLIADLLESKANYYLVGLYDIVSFLLKLITHVGYKFNEISEGSDDFNVCRMP